LRRKQKFVTRRGIGKFEKKITLGELELKKTEMCPVDDKKSDRKR